MVILPPIYTVSRCRRSLPFGKPVGRRAAPPREAISDDDEESVIATLTSQTPPMRSLFQPSTS
jgi:hypothetical protein